MGFRTRALAALRGELPDRLPYAPRLDLWHTGRTAAGNLPPGLEGASVEEICRAEGWGVYLLTSTFVYLASSDEGMAFSALGLYTPPECGYRLTVDDDVDFSWRRDGDRLHVRLETRSGAADAVLSHTPEMLRNGITYPWVTQPFIKEFEDWRIVADLFRSLRLVPDPETYDRVRRSVGEDGVVVSAAGEPGSPMHHIQKHFFPGTEFYLLYNDRRAEMEEFAAAIAPFYEQLLEFYAHADVDGVTWGGNFDETITYAPFFEEQILPWLRRAAEVLRPRGIPLLTHCDGENRGLMELIRTSGIDAAESVCPSPMTALTLREYYERWAGDLCIVGGIPADYLIPEQTSDADLDDYLRYVKSAVAPGRRFIAGITDAVPPTADFDRLRRVHEFFESDGRLPLATGTVPDIFVEAAPAQARPAAPAAEEFTALSAAVIAGDEAGVGDGCRRLLAAGVPAQAVLDNGLIQAMDARRRALRGRRSVHTGDAAGGARHAGGGRRARRGAHERGTRLTVGGHRRHRDGTGRPSRHRQEPRGRHAARRGVRRGGPGDGRPGPGVRARAPGAPRVSPGPQRPADHDHAADGACDRRAGRFG